MRISGSSFNNLYNDYGDYKKNNDAVVQTTDTSALLENINTSEFESEVLSDTDFSNNKEKQKFTAADYSELYNKDEKFDMIGIDSDINSVDVEQVISDIKKDQLLEQYQFFVKSSRDENNNLILTNMEDFKV